VKQGGRASLEAFLFDFSGDLYGARLSIEFVKKLRDEAHFASLDALAAQIQRDCEAARQVFAAS
jgi:riboflavin kinase/FMN adenylyltransferase